MAIRGPGLVAEVDRVDRISLRVVDTLTAAISRYHSLGGATGIRRRVREGRCDEKRAGDTNARRCRKGEFRDQERPQDLFWGFNAPLPPEAKKLFENLTTKWCILKKI